MCSVEDQAWDLCFAMKNLWHGAKPSTWEKTFQHRDFCGCPLEHVEIQGLGCLGTVRYPSAENVAEEKKGLKAESNAC